MPPSDISGTPKAGATKPPKTSRRVAMVYHDPRRLKPNPRNPRLHSKKHIRQICDSIQAFGFVVPILMDTEGMVIAGHARLQAALELGMTEVPTISAGHLSEAEMTAYLIADNRLAELSSWDDPLLAELLKELSAVDLGISLDVTGFDIGEIDFRIGGTDAPAAEKDKEDPADIPAPATATTPVTKSGDLWLLGEKHRIYCGNALEEASYDALMQGQLAGMIFTDPPYNVPIDGHVCGNGAIKHENFVMASGEMSEAEFTAFLRKSLNLCAHHSADGSIHYVCMDWRHLMEILTAGRSAYTELKNICIWAKGSAGMGSLYRSQHEMVLVFKKGTATHRNNVQLGKHGRNRSNVWNYPSIGAFGRQTEEGNLLAIHPTVKPVAMVADAILDCSAHNDIVLDVFLGSGTTVLAAERTGRIGYGMEMDPLYVDAAIRRFQKYTGQVATHAATGKKFDETQKEVNHE